jgi:hypothetical protein
VDHVSRPLLALLLATVGLAGTWMTVLRPHAAADNSSAPLVAPKHATPPKQTAPGAKGLGRAIDHAKGAVGAANAAVDRTQTAVARADTVPAAKPVTPATPAPVKHAAAVKPAAPVIHLPVAKPATPTEPGSARVNQALAAGKAVVLLFAGDGADDAVARQVVRSMRGPHVVPIVASISQLASYDSLLTNVDVSAAPTIVVIGPNRQASEIVGLPDVKQVQSSLRTVLSHG